MFVRRHSAWLTIGFLFVSLNAFGQLSNTLLAFHSDKDLGVGGPLYQIYSIRPDGTGFKRLTFTGAQEGAETWSPDGKQIAFWSQRDGVMDTYVMNSDGSNQHRI